MRQCWEETGKNPSELGGRAPTMALEREISLGRERVQHKTQTRAVHRNIAIRRVKLVLSEVASSDKKETVLLVIDVRRAYFIAQATPGGTEVELAVSSADC